MKIQSEQFSICGFSVLSPRILLVGPEAQERGLESLRKSSRTGSGLASTFRMDLLIYLNRTPSPHTLNPIPEFRVFSLLFGRFLRRCTDTVIFLQVSGSSVSVLGPVGFGITVARKPCSSLQTLSNPIRPYSSCYGSYIKSRGLHF